MLRTIGDALHLAAWCHELQPQHVHMRTNAVIGLAVQHPVLARGQAQEGAGVWQADCILINDVVGLYSQQLPCETLQLLAALRAAGLRRLAAHAAL